MNEGMRERASDLAKRVGLGSVSPNTLIAVVCVLATALAIGAWRYWPRAQVVEAARPFGDDIVAAQASAGAPEPSAVASSAPRVWVHVVGAVRHPGLYDLAADARVAAAVEAAGGVIGDAAPEAVNMARKVADGEQIAIPTREEAKRATGGASTAVASGAAPGVGLAQASGPVDINTATAEQLDSLPGIGPATATKIVADREANGPYSSVEDLGRVAGIGPKKLADLKDQICVR